MKMHNRKNNFDQDEKKKIMKNYSIGYFNMDNRERERESIIRQ